MALTLVNKKDRTQLRQTAFWLREKHFMSLANILAERKSVSCIVASAATPGSTCAQFPVVLGRLYFS